MGLGPSLVGAARCQWVSVGSIMTIRIIVLACLVAAGSVFGAVPQLSAAPTVSSSLLIADDATVYTVTMAVSDGDGYSDIRDMRVLFNYTEADGDMSDGRGYLAWAADDSYLARWGSTFVIADAAGGGRWGYHPTNWGGTTYITPTACETTASGGATGGTGLRIVTWTFTVKPAWAFTPIANDADAWFSDAATIVGWRDNEESFDVVAAACGTYSDTPRAPRVSGATETTIDVAIDPSDSTADLFAIRITPGVAGRNWVQPDGNVGSAPAWFGKNTWGTKIVRGLMWGTEYTFEARAARKVAGYCPSPLGAPAVAATLQHVPAIDARQGMAFDVWVRGQCPYRMISTTGYPLLWDITEGSLARGLAGGLDADTYDWRDIYSGSNWGQGGGAFTTLEFLQYARDYGASPMLTANMFGGGYRDEANDGVFVCQTDNPEGLAADWVRYTNVILQNCRQGQESALAGQDLRVYDSIADWGGKPKLLAPGEAATPLIRHWEIGNEPELGAIHPMLTNHYLGPADYRDRYKSMSAAMLAVDPDLKFGPCLINPADPNSQWLPTLAADPDARIDFVSYHPYYSALRNAWGSPPDMTYALRTMKRTLSDVSTAIRSVMAAKGRSNYGLIASEWNPVNWDGTSMMQRSVANAIGVAETVFTFAEDGVQGATFWEQPQAKLGPKNMFEGLRDYMGDTLLARVETLGLNPANLNWRVYVTRDADDDARIMIWGLNFNEDEDVSIDLSIPHCRVDSARLRRYGNPAGDTSLMTSAGMAWSEQPVAGIDAQSFTFTIPDAEVAILVLEVELLAKVDFDLDGDVDQSDFGRFQACLSGPAVEQLDPACADARLDADTDVDLHDMTVFVGCFSGSGNPADYRCTD